MGLRKSIGKMGTLAKTGMAKAKEGYATAKPKLVKAGKQANAARQKLGDYGARVDKNASQSWLLGGNQTQRKKKRQRKHKGRHRVIIHEYY